jgi:hypothetical protein
MRHRWRAEDGELDESDDDELRRIADEITREYYPGPFWKIGDIVEHPGGYLVRIKAGQYWADSEHRRGFSNHWTWRRVDGAGNESATEESGYGWIPDRKPTAFLN